MNPSKEEIKIAEKIKFWEEQEKINGVLVERLLNLNKEITVLMAEKELDRKEMQKVVSQLGELSKEILLLKEINFKSTSRIDELESNLVSLNKYKNTLGSEENGRKQVKGFRAVHISFFLSIIAILLSFISLIS